MARRLSWSPAALTDVSDIAAFIGRDSPRYAKAVVRKIVSSIEHLADMPLASAIVPELEDANVRHVLVYQFRVIVRVREDRVEVVAVLHGAREIGRMLGDRLA